MIGSLKTLKKKEPSEHWFDLIWFNLGPWYANIEFQVMLYSKLKTAAKVCSFTMKQKPNAIKIKTK